MKYALIVLYNNKNPLSSVDYAPVTDAFLSGGVFLDEVVFLPYDAPSAVSDRIAGLSSECDGVFLVCDRALLPAAKEAIDGISKSAQPFTGAVKETQERLYGAIPTGKEGAETVITDLVPRIDRRRNERYCRVVLGVAAAPEERIRAAMKDAEERAEGRLVLHASSKYGITRIEMIYNRETPKMIADEVLRILVGELHGFVFTLDGQSLAERLVDALKLHRKKIATAESFTGGGVGGAIVSVPGASAVFYEGINAYDSAAKIDRLSVNEFTIRTKGAVSDETAYEMAAGLIMRGRCDIAVATTGIAGPDSDASGLPAGSCFIAVGTRERIRVFRYDFSGDRETVIKTAVNFALYHAYEEVR